MPTEWHSSLGIVELAGLLERCEISPVEIVQNYLSRINQINSKLNAFVTVSTDTALRAARIAEEEIRAGKYRGPLHGIPVAIKDIVDTAGVRTTYGSPIFRDNVPLKHDGCVTFEERRSNNLGQDEHP